MCQDPKYPIFSLNLFKSGDALLTRNEGGFFGDRIEKKQRQKGFAKEHSRFTHIEILIIRDRKDISKFWSIRIAPPKAKLVNFPNFYKGRYVKIVRYKHYENDDKLKDVAVWAATHVNVPYDFPGILRFIFIWVKQHASMWFCSENAIWAFQQVYLKAFKGLLPHKSMPADGLHPKYVETIWEGIIT